MRSLTYQCPRCNGLPSPHPEDVRTGYCGHCRAFTGGGDAPAGWFLTTPRYEAVGELLPIQPRRYGAWLVMETPGVCEIAFHIGGALTVQTVAPSSADGLRGLLMIGRAVEVRRRHIPVSRSWHLRYGSARSEFYRLLASDLSRTAMLGENA